MTTATEYLTIAAIYALRAAATTQGMPKSRADFAQLVQSRYKYKITDDMIDRVIAQLDCWGLVTAVTDKYAGEMIFVSRAKSDQALEQLREIGHRDVITKASVGGLDWFVKVFSNLSFWDDLHNDPIPTIDDTAASVEASDNDTVPASDRLVTRADNKPRIEVLESDLRGIVDEIEQSNEVSVELGEEKELIAGELRAAETLVAQPAFRLSRLVTLVLPSLRFLAEKFATGAIGEMAKRLIAAVLGLS